MENATLPAAALEQKAAEVERILTNYYGPRPYCSDNYERDILGALIATVLSQHTSDVNSGRAYRSLKCRFPDGWDSVRLSNLDQVADAIRSGGLADVKAKRIQRLLGDVNHRSGSTNLDFLKTWESDAEILDYLLGFHGVGPKTAACILMFNLGRPAIPVDTHVHRVSRRIGLVGEKATADQAHRDLMLIVPAHDAYSFHVHLIEHGRTLCRAQRPQCMICPVHGVCDYYASLAGQAPPSASRGGTKKRMKKESQ